MQQQGELDLGGDRRDVRGALTVNYSVLFEQIGNDGFTEELEEAPKKVSDSAETPSQGSEWFGEYEIQELLNKGTTSTVYLVRNKNIDARIEVLKVIADSALTELTSMKLAATLHHPNIVEIYSGGSNYVSMAFVDGVNLHQRIEKGPLPIREAAQCLLSLARAIALAHQQKVVHLDLHPGNVLIDGEGRPKIIDFGLARTTHDFPTNESVKIPRGVPDFVSPELAGSGEKAPLECSDIYSLGGILYFLLCNRPPFQSDNPGTTLQMVLTSHPITPRDLNPNVPRDLESICLKCLRKKPAERYQSAEALAEDLDRFLLGHPVHARPVGNVERLRRWAKNHQSLAAGLFLLMMAGVAIVFFAVRYAREQRDRSNTAERLRSTAERLSQEAQRREQAERDARKQAEKHNRNLKQLAHLLTSRYRDADPFGLITEELHFRSESSSPKTIPTRAIMEEDLDRVDQLKEMPSVQLALYHRIGVTWLRLGWYPTAERVLRKALQVQRRIGHEPGSDPTAIEFSLAWAIAEQKRYREAETLFVQVTNERRRIFGDNHPLVAVAQSGLLATLLSQGKDIRSLLSTLSAYAKTARDGEGKMIITGYLTYQRAARFRREHKFEEAERLYNELLQETRPVFGENHLVVALLEGDLAGMLKQIGRYEDAERLIREVIKKARAIMPNHSRLIAPVRELAEAVAQRGDWADAESLFREALRIVRAQPEPHPDELGTMRQLVDVLRQEGKHLEAKRICLEVLNAPEGKYPLQEHRHFVGSLGLLDWEMGNYQTAEKRFRQRIELARNHNNPCQIAITSHRLALCLRDQGRLAEAEVARLRALRIVQNEALDVPAHLAPLILEILVQGRDFERAHQVLATATEHQQRAHGRAEHPAVSVALRDQSRLYFQQRQFPQSKKLTDQILAIRKAGLSADDPGLLEAQLDRCELLLETSQDPKVLQQALAILRQLEARPVTHPLRVVIAQRRVSWLAHSLKKSELAERHLRDAYVTAGNHLPSAHPMMLNLLLELARLLREQNKPKAAETVVREGLGQEKARVEPSPRKLAVLKIELGMILTDQKKHQDAEREIQDALRALSKGSSSENPDLQAAQRAQAALTRARRTASPDCGK